MIALALGGVALLIWLGLVFAHGGFWLARERDSAAMPEPVQWPAVVAVVPARDEAEGIACAIGSLAAQDYPGDFRIILVDDGSRDGTAGIARAAGGDRLTILPGAPLPAGWTGKLWAVSQGVAEAGAPVYLWLTDADIAHAPDTLRSLVARAEGEGRALVSLMAKLRCEAFAERALIPAFVFFFQMLYPFARVNRPGGIGAAAGGCMLVRRAVLEAGGGIGALRGALIHDCTFGALIKRTCPPPFASSEGPSLSRPAVEKPAPTPGTVSRQARNRLLDRLEANGEGGAGEQGPIWLGLTDRSVSIRPYDTMESVAAMISRSAYAQLRYSPLLLAGTLAGMALVYVVPPGLALFGHGTGQALAAAAWALMAVSFQPMLRFYRRSPLWGVALPLIAGFYGACTFLSAWQHHRGRGGMWKGRAQAAVGGR